MKIQDLPLETEASTAYSIVPTISLWQNTIAFEVFNLPHKTLGEVLMK